LFLTFPDPPALPAIGNAVGRAYLPGITLRQAARMLRSVSSTRA
jgi:phosphatidylglycerol lysyltransferase